MLVPVMYQIPLIDRLLMPGMSLPVTACKLGVVQPVLQMRKLSKVEELMWGHPGAGVKAESGPHCMASSSFWNCSKSRDFVETEEV